MDYNGIGDIWFASTDEHEGHDHDAAGREQIQG